MNKLCECGCGGEVKRNNRFIFNHHRIGVKNTDESKLKQKETYLKHYGVENPQSLKEIQDKFKRTCMNKYGVDNPFKSKEFKDKIKQTNLSKFGTENPAQSKTIKEKIKSVMLERYGETTNLKCKETIEKIRNTNLRIRGFPHQMQSEEVKSKTRQTSMNRYGVTHFSKTEEGRTISRINFIRMVENQKLNGEPLSPRVGDKERPCLNELQIYTEFIIKRQYPFFRYIIGRIPDGYIEELKLIILYHEQKVHYLNDEYMIETEDTIRTTINYESIGLKVFKISEKNWNENKEKVISDFKNLLSLLSEQILK